MSLPWSEEEIAAKLKPLHDDDVAKLFATVVFKRPEVLQHVPELTEQLRKARDISDPDQQLEVLDWIETALIPTPKLLSRKNKVDVKPPIPQTILVNAEPRLLSSIPSNARTLEKTDRPASRAAPPVLAEDALANGRSAEPSVSVGATSPSPFRYGATQNCVASNGDTTTPTNGMAPKLTVTSHGSEHFISEERSHAGTCILQFSTPVYYAKEGEDDYMTLDVMRLGSEEAEVSCSYSTQDGDGKAGSRYVKTEGKLVFLAGEIMKQINVDIIESPAWSSSLEFKVNLDSAVGCSLGRYLHTCRVKVIDPDCFPSNKFKTEILSNAWQSIPLFKLLIEYFRFNFYSNPIVNRRSKYQLIIDQVENAYFILRLYIGKVVIDKVLRTWDPDPDLGGGSCKPGTAVYFETFGDCPLPDDTAGRESYLLVSALIIFLPMFVLHYLEFWKVYFKIGGTSRKTLQGNLVRKFLNYDETARAQMGPSDLIMAMTRDTDHLVHDGYMQIFPLVQNLGKLGMMVGLQLYMKADVAVILVFVYPILLLAFLLYRNKLIYRLAVEEDQAQNELVNYTTQIMTSYRLIGDFQKRPDTVEEIEKKVGTFNKKMVAADAVTLNNKYVCKYLALLCIAFWNVVGGLFVIEGTSEVGKFLTNLEVFKQVGDSWTAIFEVMLKMQSALPYLEHLVTYMNLPIDLEKRMRVNRTRRAKGEEARELAREVLQKARREGRAAPGAFAADFVPISLDSVEFAYTSPRRIYEKRLMKSSKAYVSLLGEINDATPFEDGRVENCSIQFEQGLLVALIGIPEEGKSTVMKLLGSQIIPDGGDLLIPPHLRALHVSPQPLFFNDTIFHNLTYGVGKDNDEDGTIERVVGICRMLQVSEAVVEYLDKDSSKFDVAGDWGDVLNSTERVLLNLARAFIANPEVMVVHKPTAVFDDRTAENTIRCLREFVTQKGLLMDPVTAHARRPRTCIMTTTRPKGMIAADRIFKIKRNGVQEVIQDELAHVEKKELM